MKQIRSTPPWLRLIWWPETYKPTFLTDFWSPSSIKHRFKGKTPRTWPKSVEQPRNAYLFSFFDLTRMENDHQQGVRGMWRQAEKQWQRQGWRAALVKLKEARVCWLKSFRISWARV
ncbi:uncharacterized protein LOC128291782 [Gossypium arboreum]|uniref:Uncharacterized protein n=1 Tax=Gossypium arboreum TaxID=29729 RepID=A0ABR0Q9F4_GOSAR|nr:uncharacterized protein LOC128291782 [Gossypium arboreum]KAK5835903.1 hypothetical protein PVK06_011617 [Gossypium arboreum]